MVSSAKDLEPVMLARKLLSLPEGPTFEELRRQARDYLATLSPEEYKELEREAIADESSGKRDEEYLEKMELFKKLQFTDREMQAYSHMRLDSPGVRRVVARRALLIKYLKQPLPPGATFYEVARMEDSFLKGKTHEQILEELGVRSNGPRRC